MVIDETRYPGPPDQKIDVYQERFNSWHKYTRAEPGSEWLEPVKPIRKVP